MKVYAIFREGVYRHECIGIFTELSEAINIAKKFKSQEMDDYHEFEIVPFTLNEEISRDKHHQLLEADKLWSSV